MRGEKMKQKDLLRLFFDKGWWVLREGANHIILTDGTRMEPVPRHKEVNEQLAKALIRRNRL